MAAARSRCSSRSPGDGVRRVDDRPDARAEARPPAEGDEAPLSRRQSGERAVMLGDDRRPLQQLVVLLFTGDRVALFIPAGCVFPVVGGLGDLLRPLSVAGCTCLAGRRIFLFSPLSVLMPSTLRPLPRRVPTHTPGNSGSESARASVRPRVVRWLRSLITGSSVTHRRRSERYSLSSSAEQIIGFWP
jgi:hypothetical protein